MIFIQEQSQLESIIPNLVKQPSWGLDTETDGLDPHVNKVLAVQIGRQDEETPEGEVYVIDARKVNLEPLRVPFFENKQIFKILHNAKFDYKMLRGSFGISLENVRCTFLAEKILSAGLIPYLTKEHKFDRVVEKRLKVTIENKEELQKSFIGHKGDFSPSQIEYMSNDAKYLLPLYLKQIEELKHKYLMKTMKLESDVCLAFADMEFEGMKLDPQGWSDILLRNKEAAMTIKQQMDELALPYLGANLFGEIDINYASPAQVLKLLQQMKIMINKYDFTTKNEITELISKTNDEALKKVKDHPFISLLRKWRSYNTRINNFGDSYIRAIHPKTGCIHPNLWQIGTGTGRPASGESDVNPLNVPREQVYRSCFICDPNEVVESDDFSGCESRILAHISQDPKMMDIFNRGEDIHCGVATELYGVTVTKKNENKHLRTPAKALNFGISYGMGPNKLHDDLNAQGFKVTRDEAKKLYYKYTDKFKKAVTYLRDAGKTASTQGWLANLNGRRRWWSLPDRDSTDIATYNAKMAAIEREGGNFLIQSVNADITKEAMVRIREYRRENNIKTKFINAIYDEIVTRTHVDQSESFHVEKLRMMRESGEKWITSVPMTVDGSTGKHWKKD